MKITQILFLLLITVSFFQCSSDPAAGDNAKAKKAQPAKKRTQPAKANVKKAKKNTQGGLVQKLKLTKEQQAKYTEINKKYNQQGANFRKANRGKTAAIKKKNQEIRASKIKEMKTFMTPEQFKIYSSGGK